MDESRYEVWMIPYEDSDECEPILVEIADSVPPPQEGDADYGVGPDGDLVRVYGPDGLHVDIDETLWCQFMSL